jgi:HlyD family secretion protein
VNASVDESDIGEITPKQSVRFRVDAYPNDTFAGTVSQVRLQPVVQQNVVSYITVIDVPNPGLKLKPGMTAAVTIETGRAADVLKVPNAALQFKPAAAGGARTARAAGGGSAPRDDDRGAVWVLAHNLPTRVPVRIGISDGRDTAVLDGDLSAGTSVITGAAATAAPAATPATSPLLPFNGRGGTGRRGGTR